MRWLCWFWFFGRSEARSCLEAVWGIFLWILQTLWLWPHAPDSRRKFIRIHWEFGCTSQLPRPLLQGACSHACFLCLHVSCFACHVVPRVEKVCIADCLIPAGNECTIISGGEEPWWYNVSPLLLRPQRALPHCSWWLKKTSYKTSVLVLLLQLHQLCQVTTLSSAGIIGAVAKDFFNSEITMEIVNQLEELERTGKKEHVVFLVTQWPATEARSSSKTGTFPSTQSIQSLANRRNAMIWIKEVRLIICETKATL